MNAASSALPAYDTVVYVHVPRSAGTTLHSIFRRQYDRSRIHVAQSFLVDRFIDFGRMPVEERDRLQVVAGHVAFGIHELLPQRSIYVTMFRNPLERVVSFYHYVRNRPDNSLYEVATRMTLSEFISTGAARDHTDNGFTRMISGDVLAPLGGCTSAMLETAKDNLEKYFLVVGLTERFDESMFLLKHALGWRRPLYYAVQNVGQGSRDPRDLTAEEMRLLERYNQLDLELYEFAETLFERQLKEQSLLFPVKVGLFRALNVLLGPLLAAMLSSRIVRRFR